MKSPTTFGPAADSAQRVWAVPASTLPAPAAAAPDIVAHLLAVNAQLLLAALISRAEAEAARAALEHARSLAMLDGLTGLPNRNTMHDRLSQAIAQARRSAGTCALLFVDLDHFKPLNDRHGHAFGDQVLQLAAARMLSVVREVDTVCRHGGDEFVVLVHQAQQRSDAQAVAEKLLASIAAPACIGGQPVTLSASIGIALFPEDGEDAAGLVASADAAMYRSKRRGAGGFAFQGSAAS